MNRDSTGNRLLDSFTPDARDRILDAARPSAMDAGQVLAEEGRPPADVFFPRSGVASLVVPFRDGRTIEASTIGNEGMTGFETLLGDGDLNRRYVWQVPGVALRLPAEELRTVADEHPSIRPVVLSYVGAMLAQAAQTAACNARHEVGARLAKWLLLTHDRIEGDAFDLSHEFLAAMVGVRRASVTEAAGAFRKRGFIEYERARVRILDRDGLEDAACECYRAVRAMFDDGDRAWRQRRPRRP